MINDDEKKVHVLQKNLLVSTAQYAEAKTFFIPYFEKLLVSRAKIPTELLSSEL